MTTKELATRDLVVHFSDVVGFDMDALLRVIEHGDYGTLDYLAVQVEQRQFFHNMAYGWLTRSGRFYTCGYGAHEALLATMGVETYEAERAGWIRVSGIHDEPCNVQGRCIPSPAQKRALKRMDAWSYLESDPTVLWVRMRCDVLPIIPHYE